MNIDKKQVEDPSVGHDGKPPVDPSNTSHIGQNVEQGIITPNEGISEQSSEWEHDNPSEEKIEPLLPPEADDYIKNPSPEDRG